MCNGLSFDATPTCPIVILCMHHFYDFLPPALLRPQFFVAFSHHHILCASDDALSLLTLASRFCPGIPYSVTDLCPIGVVFVAVWLANYGRSGCLVMPRQPPVCPTFVILLTHICSSAFAFASLPLPLPLPSVHVINVCLHSAGSLSFSCLLPAALALDPFVESVPRRSIKKVWSSAFVRGIVHLPLPLFVVTFAPTI